MKNTLLSKGLVVGIIVLFVVVSVLSSVSSKDVSVSDDRMVEDNDDIITLDNYEEIISRIEGRGYTTFEYSGGGLIFKRFDAYDGEVSITAITNDPENRYYTATGENFRAEQFWWYWGNAHWISPSVAEVIYYGIALGNIEWS